MWGAAPPVAVLWAGEGPAAAAWPKQSPWEPGQPWGQLLPEQKASGGQSCPGNAEVCSGLNLLQYLTPGGPDAGSGRRSHVPNSVLYLNKVGAWSL